MKSKLIQRAVSMLMAMLMIISVFVVSASAEELLPEACGGEVYSAEETAALDTGDAAGEADPMSAGVLEEGDNGIPAPEEAQETAAEPEATPAENPESTAEQAEAAEVEAPEETETAAETTEEVDSTEETVSVSDTDTQSSSESGDENENVPDPETRESEPVTEKEEVPTEAGIADMGIVSLIDIQGKVVPGPRPNDPELEDMKSKEQKIGEMIGDAIIKLGESTLPFGRSISNFFRSRGKNGDNVDKVEQTVDLITDAANFVDPIAGPLVSVARDVFLKIWHCFD